MLCNVCLGVLQYRRNILVPGTIDDEVITIEDSDEEEQWGDDDHKHTIHTRYPDLIG
jgi:hypothetical protein